LFFFFTLIFLDSAWVFLDTVTAILLELVARGPGSDDLGVSGGVVKRSALTATSSDLSPVLLGVVGGEGGGADSSGTIPVSSWR
jgi:hypothetical protein